ncbi:hypothetical protein ACE6H2_027257 [Prunus campanulata]
MRLIGLMLSGAEKMSSLLQFNMQRLFRCISIIHGRKKLFLGRRFSKLDRVQGLQEWQFANGKKKPMNGLKNRCFNILKQL